MANYKGNGGFMIRGGIDVDEATLHPNANYWRGCADGELIKLQNLIGDEMGLDMVSEIVGTWKEVYEQIRDVVILQAEKSKALQIVVNVCSPLHIAGGEAVIVDGVSSPEWFDAQKETPV